MAPDTGRHVAEILNAWWEVRHYAQQRGAGRLRRAQAIVKLGLVIGEAFSRCNDFEALIGAVIEGYNPKDTPPPF